MRRRGRLLLVTALLALMSLMCGRDEPDNGWFTSASHWRFVQMNPGLFIFGPADAESIRVVIEIDDGKRYLDSLEIDCAVKGPSSFVAAIRLDQRESISSLPSLRTFLPIPIDWVPCDTCTGWADMSPLERLLRDYPNAEVFGPAGAESVTVVISRCDVSEILDSAGVDYSQSGDCRFVAKVGLEQRRQLQTLLRQHLKPLPSRDTTMPPFRVLHPQANVFGPADAESVYVTIHTDGTSEELDSLGIEYTRVNANQFKAKIAVRQYYFLIRLKSVVRVVPGMRLRELRM